MDVNSRDYNLVCLYVFYNDFINSKELFLKVEKFNVLLLKLY